MNPTSIKCQCGKELTWRDTRNYCPFCGREIHWTTDELRSGNRPSNEKDVGEPQSGQ